MIYTIGHSNRTLEHFIQILKHYDIEVLVDVRQFPRSKHNPQFNKDNLESELPQNGIQYLWIEKLGGFRKGGYEAYMRTDDFKDGLLALKEIAKEKTSVLMCAELLWFKCHRSLISSWLSKLAWRVIHIYDEKKSEAHRLLL